MPQQQTDVTFVHRRQLRWWFALAVIALLTWAAPVAAAPYVYVLGKVPGAVAAAPDGDRCRHEHHRTPNPARTQQRHPAAARHRHGAEWRSRLRGQRLRPDHLGRVHRHQHRRGRLADIPGRHSPAGAGREPRQPAALRCRQSSAVHRHRHRVAIAGRHGRAQPGRRARHRGIARRVARLRHGDRVQPRRGAGHRAVRRHRRRADGRVLCPERFVVRVAEWPFHLRAAAGDARVPTRSRSCP